MHTAVQPAIVPNVPLQALSTAIDQIEQAAASALMMQMAAYLRQTDNLLDALPPELRAGSPDNYCRHVAYADPCGRFTIVYLVWRPGQHSPVHGHKTWCAYRVLQGTMSETLYSWDTVTQVLSPNGQITRRPGDIFTAAPGLQQTHRLGNDGDGVAISLHIYGVAGENISTGVNLLPPNQPNQ